MTFFTVFDVIFEKDKINRYHENIDNVFCYLMGFSTIQFFIISWIDIRLLGFKFLSNQKKN